MLKAPVLDYLKVDECPESIVNAIGSLQYFIEDNMIKYLNETGLELYATFLKKTANTKEKPIERGCIEKVSSGMNKK